MKKLIINILALTFRNSRYCHILKMVRHAPYEKKYRCRHPNKIKLIDHFDDKYMSKYSVIRDTNNKNY
jgi:hypothetical protein